MLDIYGARGFHYEQFKFRNNSKLGLGAYTEG